MASELFKLLGTIAIDTSGVDDAVKTVTSKMETLGKNISKVGDSMTKAGKNLTKYVTAPIVGLGTAAVKSSLTFEDAMAKVSTIADTSKVSIDDLRKQILELSDDTGIASSDIAENVYNAISAGQETGDAVNFVSNATKLATSGFAETGDALDILSTIMNAYGLEASEVSNVSDMLIQTQNKGKTTVAELSSAMGKAIPTAKSVGLNLDQLCAAYAVMTSNGIATAETTTYLNSMLNELGKDGTSAAKALAEGTENIKEGGLTMKEAMEAGWALTDVLSILDEVAYDAGTSINNMFGSAEAGKAAAVLWDNASKVNTAITDMGNSAGSTEEAFKKMQTTSYDLKKTWNEVKNTLIELGGAVLEVLLPYIKAGSEKVKEFCEWFKNLDQNTKDNIVRIGLFVAAIGPLLVGFGKVISTVGKIISIGSSLVGGIGTVINVGGTLSTGIGGLVSTIGGALIPAIVSIGPVLIAVTAGIAAVVAAGVTLYKNWDKVCSFAKKVGDSVKEGWNHAKESVANAWNSMKEKTSSTWDSIKKKTTDSWNDLIVSYEEGGGGISGITEVFFDQVKFKVCDTLDVISKVTGINLDDVKEKFTNAWFKIRNNVVDVLYDLQNNFGESWEKMKNAVSKGVEAIGGAFEKFTDGIKDFGSKMVSGFNDIKEKTVAYFSEMTEKASAKITEMKEKITDGFQKLKDGATEKITDLKEKWGSRFDEAKEKITDSCTKIKDTVVTKFEDLRSNAVNKLSEVAEKGVSGFENIKSRGSEAINSLKDHAASKFSEMGGIIFEKFSGYADKISSTFSGVKDAVGNIVEKVKSYFNFDWKLPNIKLPHFKVEWETDGLIAKAMQAIGLQGLPKIGVDWYAKAMNNPMIMNSPTAFGINASGQIMAGGEKGSEVVSGTNTLMQMISEAVSANNSAIYGTLNNILAIISQYMPEMAQKQILLDSGALVGELAAPMNEELGRITYMRGRRN